MTATSNPAAAYSLKIVYVFKKENPAQGGVLFGAC
jgi:hypothetical protein